MKRTRRKTPKIPVPVRKDGVLKIKRAKKTKMAADKAPATSQLNERLYDEHGLAIGGLMSRLGGEQVFNAFVEERTDMALNMLEHNGSDLSSLAGEHRDLLLFYIAHRILVETERRLRTKTS